MHESSPNNYLSVARSKSLRASRFMLTLESRRIPVMLGGVLILRTRGYNNQVYIFHGKIVMLYNYNHSWLLGLSCELRLIRCRVAFPFLNVGMLEFRGVRFCSKQVLLYWCGVMLSHFTLGSNQQCFTRSGTLAFMWKSSII